MESGCKADGSGFANHLFQQAVAAGFGGLSAAAIRVREAASTTPLNCKECT